MSSLRRLYADPAVGRSDLQSVRSPAAQHASSDTLQPDTLQDIYKLRDSTGAKSVSWIERTQCRRAHQELP